MATDVVVLDHGEIGETVMKQQSRGHDECCNATPLDAMSAPKETLIYVTAIYSGTGRENPDFLATVDAGIHAALAMEILPRFDNIIFYLHCCRIYVIDTKTNPRSSSLHKIVEPEDIRRKTGLASSHCLASGDIMISFLGDKDGNAARSGFLL